MPITEGHPRQTVDLAHEADFAFGDIVVRPSTREFVAGGRAELLEPRIMQVLVALAFRRGEVVSREDLVTACWRGRVVGDDAINRCISAIRKLADAHGGFTLTTVARVGYRLDEATLPVAKSVLELRGRSSIVVMPFVNLSGDPEQDYFADGMVAEITRAIARFKSTFVVASSSALAFKSNGVGAREAAQQLGVRYALEGSVQKVGSRIRIAAQLIEANDGLQLWNQRFDETLKDVFELQDKVALAVVGVIIPTVKDAEIRRTARLTENLTSYDLFLRSWAFPIVKTAGELQVAIDLLDRAVALDPQFGPALSRAAMAYRNRYQFGWSDDPEHDRAYAIALAHRALAATRDDAEVLVSAASVLGRLGGDLTAIIALVDQALALNPGSAAAWFSSGRLRVNAGDAEIGAQHIQNSMTLDPMSALRGAQLQSLGLARFAQERFDEALALFQQSAQVAPEYRYTQLFLAACHGQLGHRKAAHAALTLARTLNPGVDLRTFANQSLHIAIQRQLLLAGLAVADGRTLDQTD